jgi:hypothetical protein
VQFKQTVWKVASIGNVTKPNGVFAGAFFEAVGKAVCVNIAFVLYFYYLMFLARGD